MGCNIGADRLSTFFKRIQIETYIGISPSALRTVLQQMERTLPEFQAICEAQLIQESDKTRQITAAADETFFGDLLMLVLMDLSSGYLLLEEVADDRCFNTWLAKAKPRLADAHIEINHLITDRAKALIKLATDGLACESGADLFHGQQSLSRRLGNPLKQRYRQINKKIKKSWQILSGLFKRDTEDAEISQKIDQQVKDIISLNQEKSGLKRDNKIYNNCLKSISMDVHAFAIDDNKQYSS